MNIRRLLAHISQRELTQCLAGDAFIAPYNPYHEIFPDRTTFRGIEIDLGKWLSEEGYRLVLPRLRAGIKKEVLLQKGLDVTDPLVLFVVSIPVNLIVNLVAGFLLHLALRKPRILIVQVREDGEIESCTDEKGQTISDKEVQSVVSSLEKVEPFSLPVADSDLPVPIYLEHTSKVVGWGKLWLEEGGLRVKARIDDDATYNRIESRDLVGFSLGGIAKKYECSICHKDYFACPHVRGKTYEGEKAVCQIKGFDIAEISIVSDPANAHCSISQATLEYH